MKKKEIFAKILEILREEGYAFKIGDKYLIDKQFSSEIIETTTFSDLDLDSLDITTLIMAVEEKFGINTPGGQNIENIGDLINVVNERQA